MSINIDIEYIKRIEDENEQLKERLKKESFYYEWQNTLEENAQLKERLLQSDYIKASIFADREAYKERISHLVTENTKLQNDLFSEQLEQDETEDYINKLKKEIIHLKECNLRYRNHNELLESIIGIRNNVIE